MRPISAASVLILMFASAGCESPRFDAGVPEPIRRYRTFNARTQTVRGMPFLRVNGLLQAELQAAVAGSDVSVARETLKDVIAACHQLARSTLQNEIDRLPPAGRDAMKRTHQPAGSDAPGHRSDPLSGYVALQDELSAGRSVQDLRTIVDRIRKSIDPSPKDHQGHGLFLQWAIASHPESTDPMDKGGPRVDVYEPDSASVTSFGGAGTASWIERQLLARYAPIIVQERVDGAPYSRRADEIGAVRLSGTHDHIVVSVDTASPSVYAYWQHTLVRGRRHLQLVYTYWFPERPRLKFGDAEVGHIDGATARLTLDVDNQPAIFETIMNCGCYHRCFPVQSVENTAAQGYGKPLDGKRFAIERTMSGRLDWIVPETVADPPLADSRPILFSRAGYHGLASVSFDPSTLSGRDVGRHRPYVLRPYDLLEQLPAPWGYGSMFGADGLVHGAGRLEGWLLAPAGMLSAGQPRQRGTHRIRWDQYDFDDPHLLERCLRLPTSF
ncbi:MAG: hypothetical protein ACE5F9_11865 [Phycisphaerae bacterium]